MTAPFIKFGIEEFYEKVSCGVGGFLFLSADDLNDQSRKRSALLCANFVRNFVLTYRQETFYRESPGEWDSFVGDMSALLLTAFRVIDPAFQKTTDTQFQLPKLDPLLGCSQNTNFSLCPDACKTKIRSVAGLQVNYKMPAAGVILVGTLAGR